MIPCASRPSAPSHRRDRGASSAGAALAALLATLLLPTAAWASDRGEKATGRGILEAPAVLAPAIAFWREVFGSYSRHQILIHAMDHPNKVFTVLDFRAEARRAGDGAALRRAQQRATSEAIARVEASLSRIVANGGKADGLSDEDRAVHALFAEFRDPGIYRRLQGRVRAQNGVAERTAEGLQRAGRYLPYMEEVFTEAGLPLELTRLPIVESSYDRSAYSKVAAAGVWQFMPATARHYMRLNTLVDDRRDPWLSTHAAARHLSDDYALLQDWPLAVTAYNYGRAGVRRALQSVDGDSLGDLIERFEGSRFGFASRNFYASFVAAFEVERERERYFGALSPEPPARFEVVRPKHYVRWQTMQRLSGFDEETFAHYNPAYEDLVRQGKLLIPPGDPVRIRPGQRDAFAGAYAALDSAELFDQQRQLFLAYRVRPGETLSHIARRHGTSASHLQRLNNIRDARSLRAGQSIRVPSSDFHDAPAASVPASRLADAAAATGSRLTHRVQPGETLSHIARRYGSSVARLQAANGLRDAGSLRAGARLVIPDARARSYRVARGESLWHVARQHNLSVTELAEFNGLSTDQTIRIGQELNIPPGR